MGKLYFVKCLIVSSIVVGGGDVDVVATGVGEGVVVGSKVLQKN